MTTQRHIIIIKVMPLMFFVAILLSGGATAFLVSKKMTTWGLAVPLGFVFLAAYSIPVIFFIRPRCDRCGARMKLRHEESLLHRCPQCGEENKSSYIIPDSDPMT